MKGVSYIFLLALLAFSEFCAIGQGIDVSKYQGDINWAKVSRNGAKFVYIKATEGTSIQDPNYSKNVDGARKAGLKVGSYHLYSSKTTAYQQFDNFKSVVRKSKQDLIPVLDIEERHSRGLNKQRVDKLLELMEQEYGVKPMIYTSEMVYVAHFSGKKYAKYHFFIARYKGTPKVRYTLWQYTEKGKLPGIKGFVDLSRFHRNHGMNDIAMPKRSKKKKDDDACEHVQGCALDGGSAMDTTTLEAAES